MEGLFTRKRIKKFKSSKVESFQRFLEKFPKENIEHIDSLKKYAKNGQRRKMRKPAFYLCIFLKPSMTLFISQKRLIENLWEGKF